MTCEAICTLAIPVSRVVGIHTTMTWQFDRGRDRAYMSHVCASHPKIQFTSLTSPPSSPHCPRCISSSSETDRESRPMAAALVAGALRRGRAGGARYLAEKTLRRLVSPPPPLPSPPAPCALALDPIGHHGGRSPTGAMPNRAESFAASSAHHR